MEIVSNFSLKKHNTFGIEAKAKQFVAVHSVQDLKTILQENQSQKKFILGGAAALIMAFSMSSFQWIHLEP
mgnify:CR=1 FL=1